MSDEPNPYLVAKAAAQAERLANARASQKKYRDKVRSAKPRTAADAKVGVQAHPGPAERADTTRDAYRPEAIEQLTRRRRADRDVGGMDVPKHLKKPGWDYQFMAIRILNQPVDGAELREWREGGWRPVLVGDMPQMGEPGDARDLPIEMRGLRLYTRPMKFTVEARQEDYAYALQQQQDKMLTAASGQSAVRGEDGIPTSRGVKRVPGEISIEGLAG